MGNSTIAVGKKGKKIMDSDLERKVTCNYCDQIFARNFDLRRHIMFVHHVSSLTNVNPQKKVQIKVKLHQKKFHENNKDIKILENGSIDKKSNINDENEELEILDEYIPKRYKIKEKYLCRADDCNFS